EDGIRDLTVTGVQTCALPILSEIFGRLLNGARELVERGQGPRWIAGLTLHFSLGNSSLVGAVAGLCSSGEAIRGGVILTQRRVGFASVKVRQRSAIDAGQYFQRLAITAQHEIAHPQAQPARRAVVAAS